MPGCCFASDVGGENFAAAGESLFKGKTSPGLNTRESEASIEINDAGPGRSPIPS